MDERVFPLDNASLSAIMCTSRRPKVHLHSFTFIYTHFYTHLHSFTLIYTHLHSFTLIYTHLHSFTLIYTHFHFHFHFLTHFHFQVKMSEKMKMSENMEIFTHRRNLLEFENRNRVKIAKKEYILRNPKMGKQTRGKSAKRASSCGKCIQAL